MRAASLSFQAAVLLAVFGMVWGASLWPSPAITRRCPAHAHLILLGWVSLFLFGIFYQLHPAIDHSRTALVQVCVWIAGTLTVTLGVAIGDPFAALGSVTVLVDMLLFGWLVIRRERADRTG